MRVFSRCSGDPAVRLVSGRTQIGPCTRFGGQKNFRENKDPPKMENGGFFAIFPYKRGGFRISPSTNSKILVFSAKCAGWGLVSPTKNRDFLSWSKPPKFAHPFPPHKRRVARFRDSPCPLYISGCTPSKSASSGAFWTDGDPLEP